MQRTFDLNRRLEGGELKNWASSRHKFRGELWRDEALLTVPALQMEGGVSQGAAARHGLTKLAREAVLKTDDF